MVSPFAVACTRARAGNRELLYLDLALEDQVRAAAERGVGMAGFGAAAFMRPLLQNLALSRGDNEEVCYCLKVRYCHSHAAAAPYTIFSRPRSQ